MLGLALVSLGTLAIAFPAQAAPCSARADGVYHAEDFAVDCPGAYDTSATGGIQEAIDACGSGSSMIGCIVQLPRGETRIFDQIVIGHESSASDKQLGITLRGHGGGAHTAVASEIDYDGASVSGQGVIRINGSSHRLDSFLLRADGAELGIELHAGNGPKTSRGAITDVAVTKHTGAGLAIRCDTGDACGIDQMRIVNLTIDTGTANDCIEIDSKASAGIRFQELKCRDYKRYGVNLKRGRFDCDNCLFLNRDDDEGDAAIKLQDGAKSARIRYSHFEIEDGDLIQYDGRSQSEARMLWIVASELGREWDNDGAHIVWNGAGYVYLAGNQFTVGSPNPDLFPTPPGPSDPTLSSKLDFDNEPLEGDGRGTLCITMEGNRRSPDVSLEIDDMNDDIDLDCPN